MERLAQKHTVKKQIALVAIQRKMAREFHHTIGVRTMGIEYALVDDGQKHIFELGKGDWHKLLPRLDAYGNEPDYPAWQVGGEEGMAERAIEMWKEMHAVQSADMHEYVRDVGRRIHRFCVDAGWTNLRLVNNCNDTWLECDQSGYVQTESRYEENKG